MPRAERRRRGALLLAVGLVLSAAVGLFLLATAQGTGLSSDSITYLHTARNLARHHTLIRPADHGIRFVRPTHYPPLYSAVLAVPGLVRGGVEGSARWVQALAVAGSGALLAALLHRYARPAAVVAGVALLVLSSGFLVEINGFVLSEGLFLCLTLAGLLLLLRWLERYDGEPGDGCWLLVLAGAVAGASVVTRFVGLALVGTGAVAIVLFDRRHSWRRAALYAAVGGLPLVGWLSYSRTTGYEALAGRELELHLPSASKLGTGLLNVGTWIVPERAAAHVPRALMEVIGALLLAGLAAVVIILARRSRPPTTGPAPGGGPFRSPAGSRLTGTPLLARVLAVFIGAYLAEVLVTISLLDTATPLDRRLLVPVFVTGLVLVVVAADRVLEQSSSTVRRFAVGLLLLAVLAANGLGSARDVAEARRTGLGFASTTWRDSPLVDAVRDLPPRVHVYSNAAGALYQLTGRRSRTIPPRFFGNGSGPNGRYDIGMRTIAGQVHQGDAVVVWFESAHHWFGTDLDALRRIIGEPPTIESADGTLFGSLVSAAAIRQPPR